MGDDPDKIQLEKASKSYHQYKEDSIEINMSDAKEEFKTPFSVIRPAKDGGRGKKH